jgi:hypothetical protein
VLDTFGVGLRKAVASREYACEMSDGGPLDSYGSSSGNGLKKFLGWWTEVRFGSLWGVLELMASCWSESRFFYFKSRISR